MLTSAMGDGPIPAAACAQGELGSRLAEDGSPAAGERTPRVLVVEDDLPLAKLLCTWLRSKSLSVDTAHNAEEALVEVDRNLFDLMILDLTLPGVDGLTLLKQLRASSHALMPVIVLSGRSRTEDKIDTLNEGADDYLMKPFSLHELLARTQALLRRRSRGVPSAPREVGLTINRGEYAAHRDGRRIDLTPREFAILEYMMDHKGKPVSRAALMQDVWNAPFDPSTNIVDVYMKYLRDKIDAQAQQKLIRTIRGVGYVLHCA